MIASAWRNIHFLLATFASLFLIIAALTGVILGLEAALDQTKPQAVNLNGLSLGETKNKIEALFDEVYEIELNNKGFVIVQGSIDDRFGSFYFHPIEGTVLGEVKKPSSFFQFVRNLHRSLFLKKTGRILVSLSSLLLILLVISGLFLLQKRMGGMAKLYGAIKEENAYRKGHIVLGRWLWLFVLVVGITGTYLGLNRLNAFAFVNEKTEIFIPESTKIEIKNIPLNTVEKMVYPFGNGEEETYDLILQDKALKYKQGDLTLVKQQLKPLPQILQQWAYVLHTGEGNFFFALLLTVTALGILYFIFTGLSIASKTSWALLRFSVKKEKKPVLILHGSETGNTYMFAKKLKKRLKQEGIKADLKPMNRFSIHENTQTVLILTATYGDGVAPSNATRFQSLFLNNPPQHTLQYAILGFGSRDYPKFCQFAIDVDEQCNRHPKYIELMPLFKIDKQNQSSFIQWQEMVLGCIKES